MLYFSFAMYPVNELLHFRLSQTDLGTFWFGEAVCYIVGSYFKFLQLLSSNQTLNARNCTQGLVSACLSIR